MALSVSATAEEAYRNNYIKIKTSCKRGRIQDLYTFEVKGRLRSVSDFITEIYQNHRHAFKINLAFGYILRSVGDEPKYAFYHPSNNNSFLPSPKIIRDVEDKDELTELCNTDNITSFVYNTRLTSSWQVHSIVSVAFRVTKLGSIL